MPSSWLKIKIGFLLSAMPVAKICFAVILLSFLCCYLTHPSLFHPLSLPNSATPSFSFPLSTSTLLLPSSFPHLSLIQPLPPSALPLSTFSLLHSAPPPPHTHTHTHTLLLPFHSHLFPSFTSPSSSPSSFHLPYPQSASCVLNPILHPTPFSTFSSKFMYQKMP